MYFSFQSLIANSASEPFSCESVLVNFVVDIHVHCTISMFFTCTCMIMTLRIRTLVLDCVNDEGLQTLCMGKLKLRFLDLSHSGITDKRYDQLCL